MAEVEFEQDPDLMEMWKLAMNEYRKLAGLTDKSLPANLSVDDVVNRIDQSKKVDQEANAKYGIAKEVVRKTLICINTLGGIAAQAASMVSLSTYPHPTQYPIKI
jgi:hypothetical protein